MKQLTNSERLEIAIPLLDGHGLMQYTEICRKRELGCPDGLCEACLVAECAYPDPSDPEANSFHNVPVECKDRECNSCTMTDRGRRAIDCPYVD